MNKVIEARKAADANLITRREETAAMRSQANTARILENNPTLMRLRELDVLEKIAEKSKLNVVLGEKGLADRSHGQPDIEEDPRQRMSPETGATRCRINIMRGRMRGPSLLQLVTD
jgi:hypothetical protein